MNIDIEALKRLAVACDPSSCADEAEEGRRLAEFYSEFTPAQALALFADLAEADRLAGEATRTKQDLVEYKRTVSSWMVQAAVEQGYSRNKPFDQVWGAILQERDQLKAESASRAVDLANFDWDAEMTAIRKDAERYRWLRSRDLETISQGGVFAGITPQNMILNEETLDEAVDTAIAKEATAPAYRCHKCNSTTPPPAPYRAYVTCACGERTAATAAQAGHPDQGIFAWVYANPGTGDVQISRTKQHYPGNWVENGGYTITELYTGPVSGEPAGWAYRVKLGTTVANWKVSVAEPCYGGEPGDLEVIALYKREPVLIEPRQPAVTIGLAPT